MDRAFRTLVDQVGLTLEQASSMCSTTPADQLGLRDRGRLAVGTRADLVVLGPGLDVVETWMAGRPVGEHG